MLVNAWLIFMGRILEILSNIDQLVSTNETECFTKLMAHQAYDPDFPFVYIFGLFGFNATEPYAVMNCSLCIVIVWHRCHHFLWTVLLATGSIIGTSHCIITHVSPFKSRIKYLVNVTYIFKSDNHFSFSCVHLSRLSG